MRKTHLITVTMLSLLIVAMFQPLFFVKAEILAQSGWEFSGGTDVTDAGFWTATSGSISISDTTVKNGSYSLKCTPASGSDGQVAKTGITPAAVAYQQFDVYFGTEPCPFDGNYIDFGGIMYDNWQNSIMVRVYNSGGSVYWSVYSYVNGAPGWFGEVTPSNPTSGVWYRILLVRDVSSGLTKMFVDGTLIAETYAVAHVGNTNGMIGGVGYVNYAGLEMYVENVILANSLPIESEEPVTYRTLSIRTIDQAMQPLQNTTVILQNSSTTLQKATTNGWANWTGIVDGTAFQVNATWLFDDLFVNQTFPLTVSADTTIDLICNVWNFTLDGATRHIGTDRNVTLASGSSLSLDTSSTNNILAVDSGQRPTYIIGSPYDLDTDWNETRGVFRHTIQNTTYTFQVSFTNLGGRYVARSDAAVSSVTWDGYKLTLQLDSAGKTLKVFCGANPPATTGIIGTFDAGTGMLTGTPTATTVVLDWTESHDSGTVTPPIALTVVSADLGKIQQGQNKTAKISFRFSSSSFTVTGIQFEGGGSQWTTPLTEFPLTFNKGLETEGTGDIEVQLTIPTEAEPGIYNIQVAIYGINPYGIGQTATAPFTFTVEERGNNFPKADLLTPWMIVAIGAIVALVVVALLIRRHKYVGLRI